jgi:hypothetical protein
MAVIPQKSVPSVSESTAIRVPEGAPAWVTPELLQRTLHTWQPFYDRPLTLEEALAIIQTVGQLFELISRGPSP